MKKMGEMQHVTGSPFTECVIQEQEKKIKAELSVFPASDIEYQ